MDDGGQLFSQDIVVAVGVFVFALLLFSIAGNSVLAQTNVLEDQKSADEVMHVITNGLVYSGGQPSNWENLPLASASSIGISSSNNVIVPAKAVALINDLNSPSTYSSIKKVLGAGPFDVRVALYDSSGNVLSYNGAPLFGGVVAASSKETLSFRRVVVFGGFGAALEVVLSLAK